MRLSAVLWTVALIATAVACEQLDHGAGQSGAGADGGAADGGAASEAGAIVGGGCGTEQKSGAQLCIAISTCPNVVVDTEAMPSCGFRVRAGVADLVCACGTALCPMGTFNTCADAKKLLETQTEQGVCVQLSEGRCVEASSSTSSTSSTSSSSGGASPGCDRQCMQDCGGGGGCASVCNCD